MHLFMTDLKERTLGIISYRRVPRILLSLSGLDPIHTLTMMAIGHIYDYYLCHIAAP